jgi:hypothetical protein
MGENKMLVIDAHISVEVTTTPASLAARLGDTARADEPIDPGCTLPRAQAALPQRQVASQVRPSKFKLGAAAARMVRAPVYGLTATMPSISTEIWLGSMTCPTAERA